MCYNLIYIITAMKRKPKQPKEELLLNEIQLLLAEKRTYLSLLRTGLTVFTVPLTVIAVLAATTYYHKLFSNFILGIVITTALVLISLIGLSIFYRAENKIKRLDKLIRLIERDNKRIAEIVVL